MLNISKYFWGEMASCLAGVVKLELTNQLFRHRKH